MLSLLLVQELLQLIVATIAHGVGERVLRARGQVESARGQVGSAKGQVERASGQVVSDSGKVGSARGSA